MEFPIDVLYPYYLVESELGIKSNPKTFADRIANLLVENLHNKVLHMYLISFLDIYQPTYAEHLLEPFANKILNLYHRKYRMHQFNQVNIFPVEKFKLIFYFDKLKKLLKLFDQQKLLFVYWVVNVHCHQHHRVILLKHLK